MKNTLKLLVVDDSRIMREAIVGMFANDPGIEVIAEASNGAEALNAIRQHNPDVITLDVAMPVMDGITTLKHMMIQNPRPAVMLSSLTLEGARVAFDALRYGAVDFIAKPSTVDTNDLSKQEAEIRRKIEYAASVEMEAIKYIRSDSGRHISMEETIHNGKCNKVVAMGAAEGGYGSLLKMIPHFPGNLPVSYLVSMYVEPEHVDAFASYLNGVSALRVKRAIHDEVIKPGVCYLSSGVDYMTVHQRDDAYTLHVSPAPFASRKGALDMLLFSTADTIKENSIGVLLSGSGTDGAEGMEEIIRMGGTAIIQDPKTCLCKEMVHAALERCEADYVIPDSSIAEQIANLTGDKTEAA